MISFNLRRATDRLRFYFWVFRDRVADGLRGRNHRAGVFARIYQGNQWGDRESVSGEGSNETATQAARRQLPLLFSKHRIRSMVDAACGDFHWMRQIVDSVERYVGVDIVPQLIDQNQRLYGNDRVSFLLADIAADPLPLADLILCRDCFIHFPTRLINAALKNFQQTGARYVLLTSDRNVGTYHDIPVGSFRRIDFTRPPFSFGRPLEAINESLNGERQLCLWELAKL
jgi:hypothetical protein